MNLAMRLEQEKAIDASFEEIMRELAFERMIERGLDDTRSGRLISNQDMEHQIRSCQKIRGGSVRKIRSFFRCLLYCLIVTLP